MTEHMKSVRTADGSTVRIHGLVISGTPRPVPMTVLIQAFIAEGVLIVATEPYPAPEMEQKATMNQRPRGRRAEIVGG